MIMQHITDSAFPIGGFAHSAGLEYAIEAGWIGDRASLAEWTASALEHTLIPLEAAACLQAYTLGPEGEAADWARLNEELESFRVTDGQKDAGRQMGRSFRSIMDHCYGKELFPALNGDLLQNIQFPLLWASACRVLGTEAEETVRSLLFLNLRGWAHTAVRLIPLGQYDANRYLAEFIPLLEDINLASIPAEFSSGSFSWDLAVIGHANMKSRYFRS